MGRNGDGRAARCDGANYNRVLTLGASQEGLYLASMFLFRFMHPPLLVPWSEIKVRRRKGWVFEYVIFTVHGLPGHGFAADGLFGRREFHENLRRMDNGARACTSGCLDRQYSQL
jgi:hypothetical protein